MRYGTHEQGGNLYGLFSKSYVVQHAKHDQYCCRSVQECYLAANVLTSALALIWLTWKSGAKALNVVCWGTGLQIVQPLWTSNTAKTVMKEIKIAWVKHGWPEIVVRDQGSRIHGK